MDFERARADSQPVPALLIGNTLGDHRQHFTLPRCQKVPDGRASGYLMFVARRPAVRCQPLDGLATARYGTVVAYLRCAPVTNSLQDIAHTFRFVQRLPSHFAYRVANYVRAIRRLISPFDLMQIEQQRGKRLVELMSHRRTNFVNRADPGCRYQVSLELVQPRRLSLVVNSIQQRAPSSYVAVESPVRRP